MLGSSAAASLTTRSMRPNHTTQTTTDEALEAVLGAQARRLVVLDPGETSDELVSDLVEVLTSFCARLYGRRGARNRALRAVTCAKQLPGHRDGGGGQG
jgi:putative resolvase